MVNVRLSAYRLPHRVSRLMPIAALLAIPLAALPAPTSPFVAVTGGVWDRPGNPIVPEVVQTSATGPLTLTTGSLPVAFGRYEGSFGANKHFVSVRGGDDREVAGGSVWSDGFTVVGGSGSGVAHMSTRITGTVAGRADMGFALYTSDRPFDWQVIIDTVRPVDFWNLQLPNATRRMFTGIVNGCGGPFPADGCGHFPYENFQGTFAQTLVANVPFTYGQPFYVASLFTGDAAVSGGVADFSNSANFGIGAPTQANIESLSGTTYAAAVPEPRVWAMLLVGLAAIGALGRSRRPGWR